jgi:hypothetical protein
MPLLRKELHKRVKGSLANDEDWWRLVFDTDAKRLYVEHEWSHVDLGANGRADSGKAETDIATFLAQGGEGAPQRELAQLLHRLFEEESNA